MKPVPINSESFQRTRFLKTSFQPISTVIGCCWTNDSYIFCLALHWVNNQLMNNINGYTYIMISISNLFASFDPALTFNTSLLSIPSSFFKKKKIYWTWSNLTLQYISNEEELYFSVSKWKEGFLYQIRHSRIRQSKLLSSLLGKFCPCLNP